MCSGGGSAIDVKNVITIFAAKSVGWGDGRMVVMMMSW